MITTHNRTMSQVMNIITGLSLPVHSVVAKPVQLLLACSCPCSSSFVVLSFFRSFCLSAQLTSPSICSSSMCTLFVFAYQMPSACCWLVRPSMAAHPFRARRSSAQHRDRTLLSFFDGTSNSSRGTTALVSLDFRDFWILCCSFLWSFVASSL